jgi:DNA-binding MarR family transcriptional regulator
MRPSTDSRDDLHWLALQLFRGLGSAELPAVRRHGLSLWGYEVLTRLAEGPAVSQIELAQELGLDKSKIMRVIDELEAAGLAVRDPDRSDRRRRTVSLTARGRRARAEAKADLDGIEQELLEQLPATERETVRRGLRHLVAALGNP